MKPKSFLLFVVAAGCGLVAMLGIKQAMTPQQQQEEAKERVLMAKIDIPASVPLTEEFVEFREMAASQVPFGAVTKKEDYDNRALKSAAVKNEIIMLAKLGQPGEFDASTEIPEGMRLVSVPVTLTTSHSGQIRPTDRVDVFVTYSADGVTGGRNNLKTKLVLDYIEVFAIDNVRNSGNAANDNILTKNVSLLVTPRQASILIMAQSKGDLQLALRAKDDANLADVDPLDEREFDQIGTNETEREKEEEKENDLTEAELVAAKAKGAEAQSMIEQLKAENERLMAQMKTMAETKAKGEPVPVIEKVQPAESWKIQVFAGSNKSEYEFDVESEEGSSKDSESLDSNEAEKNPKKTTSVPASEQQENVMQNLLNRVFANN